MFNHAAVCIVLKSGLFFELDKLLGPLLVVGPVGQLSFIF
uniref:Uncharacterized protein n=1 Tax=Rhizophora mucronata TaxID=61149 RepID=A0A2P2NSR5_RHIMU